MNNVILNLIEGVFAFLFLLGLILLVLRYIALPILALILSPILYTLNAFLRIIMFVIIILKKIVLFLGSLFGVKKQNNIRKDYYKESDYISWEDFMDDVPKDNINDSPYSILGVSPDDSLDTLGQIGYEFNQIGNNINQIAKKVNENEEVNQEDFEKLHQEFKNFKAYFRKMEREFFVETEADMSRLEKY